MKKLMFPKGRKLVAIALAAAMAVTCAGEYQGEAPKAQAKAAARATDGAVQVAGASAGITGKEVFSMDFESNYEANAATYVENGGTYNLTNATIEADPVNAGNKALKVSQGYLKSVAPVVQGKDLSKGVAVSLKICPTTQVQGTRGKDWNGVFALGSTETGGWWCGVDGTVGFIARAVHENWANSFPGANWAAGANTVNNDFNYIVNAADGQTWYTLTYVYAPNRVAIYMNGALITEYRVVDGVYDGNATPEQVRTGLAALPEFSKLALGSTILNTDNWYCDGYYDDVKVYELSTSDITLPTDDAKYTCTGNVTNIVHGSDVTFKVTPKPGYSIKSVKADGAALTGDGEGNYTIENVTANKAVTVETDLVEYPIHKVVDGGAPTDTVFTIEDAVDGKIELPAITSDQLGWFTDPDEMDASKAITSFTAADYMTDDGITVYMYNPKTITEAADARDGLTGGTFETLDTTKTYIPGAKVEIKATPDSGKAPKITVVDANDDPIETMVVKTADGGQAVRFTMPSTDVTIKKYEFTGLDLTALSTELTTDQAVYDTENIPDNSELTKKYTEETWNVFKEAYEAAKAVKEKGTTGNTQAAIDEALAALREAKEGLVFTYKVTLKANTSIERGGTERLVAFLVSDASPIGTVTWSSSNEEVATVADGIVTAAGLGTATITFTAPDGTKAECKVKVIASVTDITLTDSQMILGAKQKAFFAMGGAVTPADATELDITWTSSDEAVAAVDAQGNITAKTMGTANITAEVNGHTATASVTVIDHVDATGGYRAGQSPWMEVGEEGAYLSFKNTTNNAAVNNWDTPNLVVDSGNGEYVIRADLFALVPAGQPALAVENRGTGVDWPSFLAENKAGADCYVSAVKVGNSIRVRMTIGSLASEAFVPLTGDGPFKVALSGENCDMTELKATDKYHFNDPGPTVPVPPSYPGSVVTPKPVITPGPVIDVPIAVEDIKVEQSLTGTAWWEGNTVGQDYALSGKEVSMVLYVGTSKLLNDYGAFNIELVSDGKYLTTGSDLNAWTAGDGVTGSISGIADEANRVSALKAGHVYRITVTRKGNDITVNYYDATEQKDYFEVKASGVNFSDNMNVHVIAQVGTFEVGQQVDTGDNPTTGPDVTAAPSAGPDETAAPTKEPDATAGPSSEPTKEPGATTEPSAEPTKEPGGSTGAKPGSKVTVSGSTYKVNAGTQVTYTAKKKAAAAVTVPATVKIKGKTYKVTSIAANAFKGNKAVKKITVGKNVTKIGKNAFGGCKKLKTIVIKSTKLKASKVTKGAFKGITKKTVIKVPKAKLKAYKKMFRKKGLNKKVKVKAI